MEHLGNIGERNETSVGSERKKDAIRGDLKHETRSARGSCEHTGKDVCHSAGRVCR